MTLANPDPLTRPPALASPLALPLTPPLKWAGGKRWLVPTLRHLYDRFRDRRLVELFAGGLAISLGLLPETALLNDVNPHAINFYRWLQAGLMVDIEMQNERAHYAGARERFNELIWDGGAESREAASLFYYLNRTCFNGLCRFNRSGQFNVPFGRYKTISYKHDFQQYVPVLRDWTFTCGDFQAAAIEPTDFIYADPPYDVEFRQYSSNGFAWEQQVRLAEYLAQLPGPVVASNQATERILSLYQDLGFEISIVDAPRLIACNGNRTPAREMIAKRNL